MSSKPFPFRWWLLTFLAAFLLAACIRLPFFGQIPAGLNRDEAALGYNAYSLLKTGKDEYGRAWPISITSFGDQKLPGYVYSLIPVIKIFGLTVEAVRLPALLAGLLLVVELGILARQVARRLDWSERTAWWLATSIMLFVAMAPWANHFSRVAYEANVALALFVGGLITYHWALDWVQVTQLNRWQPRLLWWLTAVLWSATLLTYHSYQIFLPLMVFALILIDWRQLRKADRWGLVGGVAIAAVALILLVAGGVVQANLIKSRGISPFRTSVLSAQYVPFRANMPQADIWYARLLFNKQTETATILFQNYASAFAGNFFFVHGTGHGDSNPGQMNNFHLYVAPLVVLGVAYLWTQRRRPVIQRVAAWLFLGIVPAVLTISPQHEVRLLVMFPAVLFVAALGLTAVLMTLKTQQKTWWRRGLLTGLLSIMVITTLRMCVQYWFIIPTYTATHEKDHLLAQALLKYQTSQNRVITNSQTSSPYIWYLFESKPEPTHYLTQVERYQPDGEGFIHVRRIDNIYFQTIDWDALEEWAVVQPLILILPQKDLPDDKKYTIGMKYLDSILTHDGKVAYEVWEWQLCKSEHSESIYVACH